MVPRPATMRALRVVAWSAHRITPHVRVEFPGLAVDIDECAREQRVQEDRAQRGRIGADLVDETVLGHAKPFQLAAVIARGTPAGRPGRCAARQPPPGSTWRSGRSTAIGRLRPTTTSGPDCGSWLIRVMSAVYNSPAALSPACRRRAPVRTGRSPRRPALRPGVDPGVIGELRASGRTRRGRGPCPIGLAMRRRFGVTTRATNEAGRVAQRESTTLTS